MHVSSLLSLYQLELTAKLVNTSKNELSTIQMSWSYDKEMAAILVDGEDLSEAKREESLKNRAADILNNFNDRNYFTSLLWDKQPLEFAEAENYKLRLNDEARLELSQ